MKITDNQKKLMRHALGLPNKQRRSYRNHFVTGAGTVDHHEWLAMTEDGLARRRDGASLPFGGDDLFHLTPTAAQAALLPGEQLCSEDFPAIVVPW